jgi:hypothetical protein
MFDVFYSGVKPGLFAHERRALDIDHARELTTTRYFWWTNYLTDYTGFDFLSEPVPWQATQRHAWPSQWQRDSGTYLVPKQGYTDTNYHTGPKLTRLAAQDNWHDVTENFDYTWHPDYSEPPMIYQFGTQHQRTGGPRYVVPGATEVKYVRTLYYNKTSKDANWIVPAAVDVGSFDFTWHPDATDPPYRYQFGTQHQRTGGPEYIIPGAVDVKYVDQIRIKTQPVATQVFVIDHLDNNAADTLEQIKTNSTIGIANVRYFDNYLDTLKRIALRANSLGYEFVWICSSVCDYSKFDFTWHPEQWQATMLHVFASDNNKFGDTFYMHAPSFHARIDKFKLLDWYDLNFVGIKVPRRSLPVVRHNYTTQVDAIKNTNCPGPLAIFTNQDNIIIQDIPTVDLWREKTKTIVPLSAGGTTVIVPKTSIPYIKTQLYDYPYIDRTQSHMYTDPLLDIVFIDNGELNADDNYNALCQLTKNNKVHRSSGVVGRVAAYQAAARLSTTPWFFAVFAKLQVDTKFNWAWQPDRLQEPKHYIFHAHNPITGLTYGHQAMIAYNTKLVLANTGPGLDFTLDSAHEVVPILSGTAEYADTAWSAWRTAFRECIKLKCNQDVESEYRLTKWLTGSRDYIPNAEYSKYGAEDAVEYYTSVAGNFAELKKSYDWAWLASYAFMRRNLLTSQ